jgi:hypothetical protein
MATNYFNVRGYIKWAKLYEPDEYLGVKRWIVNFYPKDTEQMEKLKASGLGLKVGKDEDGEFVKLRRPCKKEIKDNIVVFAPPKISGVVEVDYVDQDGNPITSYNKGDGREIIPRGQKVDLGNMTEGIVNYSVYGTAKGNGHRLEGFKVIELVEYAKLDNDLPEEEQEEEAAAQTEIKEKSKGAKVTKAEGVTLVETESKPTLAEDMNDELPW